MAFTVGDSVVINKCEECPAIVGKVAKITAMLLNDPQSPDRVIINFGRGRPQNNRPDVIPIEDVSIDRSRDVTCSEISNEDNRS